ncbi:MAG: hypothetical protein ABWX65_05955 [Mycetocola sp.]
MRRSKPSTTDRAALRRCAADDGTAALEFITAGLILLVPLVYLIVTLSAVQAGAFAVEGAARQAARVFAQAPDAGEAAARATRAIEFGLADYGIDADSASASITCAATESGACPARNAVVTVTIRLDVTLPLVPDVLDLSTAASIPLEATAKQQVSRFWSER